MSEAATPARLDRGADALADLAPRTQALLDKRPMGSAIERLPGDALENLLVVTVGREPGAVEAVVRAAGGDPSNVGMVPVSSSPVDTDTALWTAPRVGPSDLTGVSIGISRGMRYVRPEAGWLLVDDLGVLLMHAEETRIYQLLTALAAKCRSGDVRGIYALSRDAAGDETYARFRELFDVEVGPE